MAALKLAFAVILCVLLAAPMANAAIACGQVTCMVSPCLNYLKSGGAVPAPCCTGIRNLAGAAKTTPDRQTACRCLQSAAKGMGNVINAALAAGLPDKCGVNIPYNISASINCNSVK